MLQSNKTLGEGQGSYVRDYIGNADAQGEEGGNPLQSIILRLKDQHRRRTFAQDQRKRLDLALGAYLRLQFGWTRALPKAESDAIKAHANELIEIGEAEHKMNGLIQRDLNGHGKRSLARALAKVETADAAYHESRDIILATIQARSPFDAIEERTSAELKSLAQSLPVWGWVESVKGLGAISLATIIGETGDLSNYANAGKLRKRFGLAPITQGNVTRAGSTWAKRGGLHKEEWILAGYSPRRRSRMFVIGDCLIKQDSPYRQIYVARKEYEKEKAEASGLTVLPSARIPKGKAEGYMSEGYIHRRAQRYMEQKFARDLWRAWRRASIDVPERARPDLPASNLSDAA